MPSNQIYRSGVAGAMESHALMHNGRPQLGDQEQAVRTLLEGIGEDPGRDGLEGTPSRFVKAFHEMTAGYGQDPAQVLGTLFEEAYDAPVSVTGIPYWSLCEHHLLPFHGTADITYVPNGKVVGLSKLSRIVQCFARRLQMQERMTREIADALAEHLGAQGVRVVVHGEHTCMAARGIRTPATMTTCVEHGVLAVVSCPP